MESQAVSHCSTVFSQFLRLMPRHEFERLARQHGAGQLRRMTRWKQFVAMATAQVCGRASLRDIETTLKAQRGCLYHLGAGPVARSSLARVNEGQPAKLYEALFYKLAERVCRPAPGHRFRFKAKLFSFDATLVALSLSLFPWAYFAKGKAALKLHLGLDHGGYLPVFARMSEPHASEGAWLESLELPKGSIAVFDKGYISFALLASLHERGLFFVTRAKRHNRMRVIERRGVPAKSNIEADEIVEVTGKAAKREALAPLRRVRARDPETGKTYDFLTNITHLSATTIAALYKERWQIELFFKWIKQNLRIKALLGQSLNAVMTQIWIALCIYLLIAYLKFLRGFTLSLQQILRLLHVNLFARRDLVALLSGSALVTPSVSQQNQLVLL